MKLEFLVHWSPPVVLLVLAVIIAACWFFYRGVLHRVRPRHRPVILALRFAAAALLVMFLFQPVLSYPSRSDRGLDVLVLVDTSESMAIADSIGARSRLDAAKEIVAGSGGLLNRMPAGCGVKLAAFDASAKSVTPEELAAIEPAGKATNVGRALETMLKGADVAAVVVITDGADTTSADWAADFSHARIPVYAIGVGGDPAARPDFKDLSVDAFTGGPRAFKNIAEELCVTVSARGFAERELAVPVTLTLSGPDGVIEKKSVTFRKGTMTHKFTFDVTPKATGFFTYTVSIDKRPEEKMHENNTRSLSIYASEAKIRVLLIDGVQRWETSKFLASFLKRDPHVRFTGVFNWGGRRVTRQGDAGPWKGADVEISARALESFDLIILGDVGADAFTSEQLAAVRDFVDRRGGGLITTGGYHAYGPGGYGGTVLEPVLPVALEVSGPPQYEEKFRPRLTAEGAGHPIFRGYEEFFAESDRRLTPLDGCTRVGRKASGEVLLETPEGLPVLATAQFGKGRAAAFTADTTWRWFLQMKGMGADSPYERFWGQMLRWCAHRGDEDTAGDAPVSVWADSRTYRPGEEVTLYARIRPEAGAAGVPTLTLSEPSGSSDTLELTPHGENTFTATARPAAPGMYTARAALPGGRQAAFDFLASGQSREFNDLRMRADALAAAAHKTGGAFYTVPEAGSVPEDIEKKLLRAAKIERVDLFGSPLYFLVFLGLLTAEWILRKRNMLL
jgi:uncharacterized membrane protein